MTSLLFLAGFLTLVFAIAKGVWWQIQRDTRRDAERWAVTFGPSSNDDRDFWVRYDHDEARAAERGQ